VKPPLHLEDLKSALEAKPRHGGTELSEADYKRRLVSEINRLPEARARRIEDRYATGVLDLIIALPGIPLFWAEGKVIKHNMFSPTPIQFEEGQKWLAAGVRVVLIGWHHGAIYLSDWKKEADRRQCLGTTGVDHVKALQEFMR
jgi:hypothetical protein